jgi:hypothetical protein
MIFCHNYYELPMNKIAHHILLLSCLSILSLLIGTSPGRAAWSITSITRIPGSYDPSISADGRYIAYGFSSIFVYDMETGSNTLVSVSSSGEEANDTSSFPYISSSGRFITFSSGATNLVSGDTNDVTDVFVHDMQTGITARASVDSNGIQGNENSFFSSISSDGRYVAFYSEASNLVSNDENSVDGDVFLHDMQTGHTTLVSVNSAGDQGKAPSYFHGSISADGRYVAFQSLSDNYVIGDINNRSDVFVRDLALGQTTCASVSSSGQMGNGDSSGSFISESGRYVIFTSSADNLVSGDTNNMADVFVRDLQTGQTTRVSVSSTGAQGNEMSGLFTLSISGDGRYAVFESAASNLVEGDTNGVDDVFLHDMQTGGTARLSASASGEQGNAFSGDPAISADGHYAVFQSGADNLVNDDADDSGSLFITPVLPVFIKLYLPLIYR